MKAKSTIKKEIRKLRQFIDGDNNDLVATRVAYAVETALRWTVEDVVGWPNRVDDAKATAELIRRDL